MPQRPCSPSLLLGFPPPPSSSGEGIAGASFENKVKRVYFGLDCLYFVRVHFLPPKK